MLVGYLLMKRKIVKMMSGYQVLRSTLQFLGEFAGVSSLCVKPENGREKGELCVAFLPLMLSGVGWTERDEKAEEGWMEQLAERWVVLEASIML